MPQVASQSLRRLLTRPGKWTFPAHVIAGRRVGGYKYISISQTPSTPTHTIDVKGASISASSPDAEFEVLGSPYSLLSVTLSPSQPLHTRRGTLVGLSGDPANVVSTLRTLNPIRRALVGIPFLYQRVTSTTPVSLLVSPKSTNTTLSILQLDGTMDWKLAQRASLLAWTGSRLEVKPTISTKLSLVHWGTSDITGRGLVCLCAKGHTFALELGAGESYVAHPSNILAYTTNASPPPLPFRFRSSQPRFQIPLQLGNWFPDSRFSRAVKTSSTYKFFQAISLRIKTWSRRTIWGDRLFLRFEGPATILLQSRGNSIRDILTREEVNEIADVPAGAVGEAVRNVRIAQEDPYLRAQSSKAILPKSDAERMGVHGATPSAQTSKAAEEKAPQIVDAESGPAGSTTKSPGAKELERLGREPLGGKPRETEKAKQEKKLEFEAGLKGTDHNA